MFLLDGGAAAPAHLLKEFLIGKQSRDAVSALLRILLFEDERVHTVFKDLTTATLERYRRERERKAFDPCGIFTTG